MIKSILSHRVSKNSGLLMLVQLANYGTPLLMLWVLTSRLGFESYSLLAFVLATTQIIAVFTDYGFNLSATEKLAKRRQSKRMVCTILGSVIALKLILFVISGCVLVLSTVLSAKFSVASTEFRVALLIIFANTFMPIWFFLGLEKMSYITKITIGSKVAALILLFFFIQDSNDTVLVLIINGVGASLGTLIGYIYILKTGYMPKFRWRHFSLTAQYGFQFFATRIVVSGYTSFNSFFLGLIGSIEMVGIYAVAEQFYRALQGLFMPIYQAIYPYMAREGDYQFFFKALAIVILGLCAGLPLAYILFPSILEITAGSEFMPAIEIFNILLLVLFSNVISSFLGYPFFVGIGRNDLANRSILIGGIGHFIIFMTVLITMSLEAATMAWIALATETIILTIRLFLVAKYRKRWMLK